MTLRVNANCLLNLLHIIAKQELPYPSRGLGPSPGGYVSFWKFSENSKYYGREKSNAAGPQQLQCFWQPQWYLILYARISDKSIFFWDTGVKLVHQYQYSRHPQFAAANHFGPIPFFPDTRHRNLQPACHPVRYLQGRLQEPRRLWQLRGFGLIN